jgi:hypothetical protein
MSIVHSALIEKRQNKIFRKIQKKSTKNRSSLDSKLAPLLDFRCFNGRGSKRPNEVKFLGVTIDNQLKFKTHFQHVTKKVRSGLAALTFTKHILNYTAKLQIYNGLIKPFLEYCPLVWMTKLKSTEMNTTLQKKNA